LFVKLFLLLFDIISQTTFMKAGSFYPHYSNTDRKMIRRSVLLFGLLWFGLQAFAAPVNTPPSFVNGTRQTFTVCENSPATSINTLMAVFDPDLGQFEIWTIVSGSPVGSILGGFPTFAPSNGGVVIPSGLTYKPAPSYSGIDSFIIQVSDGIAVATTTVIVTVNPLPLLTSPLSASVCGSALFTYVPTSIPGTVFTWNRAMVAGISNAAASGTGIINETLVNTTVSPVATTYVYTLTASGCVSNANVSVTVNPLPTLSSTLTPPSICDSTLFTYSPSSAVPGTVFNWGRAAIAGISNPSATGVDAINEYLKNSTPMTVPVAYVYTLTANGCSNAQTVTVTVNPLPTLTSTLTPPDICDGAVFSYVPTSASPGATFNWSRAFAAGITNPSDTGSGNPFETLVSLSYRVVPVTYAYILEANGCFHVDLVVVNVKPTPRLSSALADTICSGAAFVYNPTSLTTGTTYTWYRPSVAGVSPVTSVGVGGVTETLSNGTTAPVNVTYQFTLTAYGCTSSKNVILTVNNPTIITTIATETPSSVCSGALFQNFGAGMPPPAGVTYSWSAVNATIYSVGGNEQFSLVNFPNGGTALIILTTKINSTGCISADTFTTNVNAAGYTAAKVIYSNGLFVYLDNKINAYQWGYDNAATLDSTAVAGATFQSYPNNTPDFADNYYWVMTNKNGCWQKTYFNQPLPMGVKNAQPSDNVSLNVYPNPAISVVTVELNGASGNTVDLVITDMLGQTIKTQSGTAHTMQFNVADIPSGCYLVSCSRNGMKIATSRFIKY
jgi:hypothetical protein